MPDGTRLLAGFAVAAACRGGSDRGGDAGPARVDPLPDAATANPAADDAGTLDGGVVDAGHEPDADAAATLRQRYQRVLHLGDSEVGFRRGLTRALERRFKAAGVKFYSHSQTSEGIRSFAASSQLDKMLRWIDPQAVVLNLGTNNLTVPHPETLAPQIRSIVSRMQGKDCFWIGPPHLPAAARSEAAMVKVIADNVAPCRFFDSSLLVLPMQNDHVHPDDRGGELWADQVFRFVVWGEPPRGPFRPLTP